LTQVRPLSIERSSALKPSLLMPVRSGAAEMIDHDLHAGGLQRGQDFRQVVAFDVRMNVPVEIGEAAEQGAIVEGGDVGQLRQADEGKPHADEAVAAHRLQREAIHIGLDDGGSAQALPMRRHAARM
jgi:hypothetical protein